MHARLYIAPGLGSKRLNKLSVRDVQGWLNGLGQTCQCCAQRKDAARPEDERRCCARGKCCRQVLSRRTIQDVRGVLRSALSNAVVEEIITRNVAALAKVPSQRRTVRYEPWSVEEARRFLVSARADQDPFYPGYVLILVLGLRRGELLGLSWRRVNLDTGELLVRHGLQRIGGQLVLGDTKTEGSEATLPLPAICVAALKLRQKAQADDQAAAGMWLNDEDLVFTTRHGTAIEPRNFLRSFDRRCEKARVRKIRIHDTRHTCGSLLAALDVHPRVAMQILRHSKIAVTMEIYTHVPSDLTREALRRLGDSLDGSEQG